MFWRLHHKETENCPATEQGRNDNLLRTSDMLPPASGNPLPASETTNGVDYGKLLDEISRTPKNSTSTVTDLTWKDIKHLRKEFGLMAKTSAIYMSRVYSEGGFSVQVLTFGNGEREIETDYEPEGFRQPGQGWVNAIMKDFANRNQQLNKLAPIEIPDTRIPLLKREKLALYLGNYANEYKKLTDCSQHCADGSFKSVKIYERAKSAGGWLLGCELLEKEILKDKSIKDKFTKTTELAGND
jgi:hypothetical protein